MTCYYCYWFYTDDESHQFCSMDQDYDNEDGKCPYFLFDNGEVNLNEV